MSYGALPAHAPTPLPANDAPSRAPQSMPRSFPTPNLAPVSTPDCPVKVPSRCVSLLPYLKLAQAVWREREYHPNPHSPNPPSPSHLVSSPAALLLLRISFPLLNPPHSPQYPSPHLHCFHPSTNRILLSLRSPSPLHPAAFSFAVSLTLPSPQFTHLPPSSLTTHISSPKVLTWTTIHFRLRDLSSTRDCPGVVAG